MENKVLEVINNRVSTRNFKENQISDDELKAILDAGIQAPCARNNQPWHFTVIQNKEFINLINEKTKEEMLKNESDNIVNFAKNIDNIFYDAPTIIVVSGKKNSRYSIIDCSAATENMIIAGESMGVGSVWIGLIGFFFTLEEEVKKLNIPEGYEPFYAVSFGYKNEVKGATPRNKDVINYIR